MNHPRKINVNKFMITIIYFISIIYILVCMYGKILSDYKITYLSYSIELLLDLQIIFYLFLKGKYSKLLIKKNIILPLTLILYEFVVFYFTDTLYFPYYIINTFTWPLLLVTFIIYCSEHELPKIIEKSIFVIYIVIAVFALLIIKKATNDTGDIGYIFLTYFVLTYLPLILVLRFSNIIKKISIIIAFIILILTTKRAGLIAFIISIIIYIMLKIHNKKELRKNVLKKIYVTIAFVFVIITIYLMLKNSNLEIIKRFRNISIDGGSGRKLIWKCVYDSFMNSPIMKKLFGHGFHSVYYNLKPLGKYSLAHNSFLEYLYDCGVVGLFMLLNIIAIIIKKSIRIFKEGYNYAPGLIASIIIAIILGTFSYFFEESRLIIPCVITWGICIGNYTRVKGGK